MEQAALELFLHGNGQPQVVIATQTETLRAVLARLAALPSEGQFVFVGESQEALAAPEDESDTCEAVDIDLTIEQLRLGELRHIQTRAVHRVEVTVYFNSKDKKRRFAPTTTIATATAWAKERFKIDPIAGADMVLSLRPTGARPRPDEHLGDLLQPGSHELEFDLVTEVTPQG